MKIEVKRVTPPELWREFAEMTSGKKCKMSWLDMLKTGHSPIREQRYFITFRDVPQFVCGHIIRHDKFANPGVQSKRVDHGGRDFRAECDAIADTLGTQVDNIEDSSFPHTRDAVIGNINDMIAIIKELPKQYDRYGNASFVFDTNAEEIISISRARLCSCASVETRQIWQQVLDLIEEIDPDLVKLCKRPCVWYGFCRERKPCGYMASDAYIFERKAFKNLFKPKV